MTLAMVLIPTGDAIAKHLGTLTAYSPEFMAWSRFAIATAILMPVALATRAFEGTNRLFVVQQAVRGAVTAAAISFIVRAVQTTPLADAFGAYFLGPILAVVLAALLLGERVNWLGWVSVLLGFGGVLLVVKPSPTMDSGLLWALLGGACYAGILVSTRWAAGNGRPIAQLTAQFAFGCVFLAPVGVEQLSEQGVQHPGWLLLMCACSVVANLLAILALGRAPAAYLAPVVYMQLVAATAISVLVFGDALDGLALLGLMVIILSGLTRIPMRFQRATQ